MKIQIKKNILNNKRPQFSIWLLSVDSFVEKQCLVLEIYSEKKTPTQKSPPKKHKAPLVNLWKSIGLFPCEQNVMDSHI